MDSMLFIKPSPTCNFQNVISENFTSSHVRSFVFVILPATGGMARKSRRSQGLEFSFYAVTRGNSFAKKLRVPPKFMKHLSGDMEDTATLVSNSTRCWRVGVLQAQDTIYFKGGWENFFRDHSLGNDELLSFTYKGEMFFHVKIFGVHQCLITECAPRPPQDQHPPTRPSPVTVDSFTSPFPYFKTCLRKSTFHPFYMLTVHKTAKMILNLPPENVNFIMRTDKRAWDVTCLYVESADQHRFSKGWRSVALDNELKAGDTCIFEIVARFELFMHIFRS